MSAKLSSHRLSRARLGVMIVAIAFVGTWTFASASVCATAQDLSCGACDESWIFARGPYSHDRETGQRVVQFAEKKPSLRNPNAWWESPAPRHFYTHHHWHGYYHWRYPSLIWRYRLYRPGAWYHPWTAGPWNPTILLPW